MIPIPKTLSNKKTASPPLSLPNALSDAVSMLDTQSESVTFSVVDRRAKDTSQRAIVNSRFAGVIGRKSGVIGRKSDVNQT